MKFLFILLILISKLSLASSENFANASDFVQSAWVLIGPNNQAIARVNTKSTQCPIISIDGKLEQMSLRASAATIFSSKFVTSTALPDISTTSSVFSTTTCESILPGLPGQVSSISVGTWKLPVPKVTVERILVLGDTGCRLKKSSNSFQDCLDEKAWPFPKMAEIMANMKPDLVIHVGDYHYRESACPQGNDGCANSPSGYGSDAWDADLFKPAAPLLNAAPWIFVRGNHEECARAGQGWFRYLDSLSYQDCSNYSDPYAVTLDNDTQVLVFDSSGSQNASKDLLLSENSQKQKYLEQLKVLNVLANSKNGRVNIFASHHPILGWVPNPNQKQAPTAIASTLTGLMHQTYGDAYFPEKIHAALHGHVHNMQIINSAATAGSLSPILIVGNGGDDHEPDLPLDFSAINKLAPTVKMKAITHTNRYGFLLMERAQKSNDEKSLLSWNYKFYEYSGSLMLDCKTVSEKNIVCDKNGRL